MEAWKLEAALPRTRSVGEVIEFSPRWSQRCRSELRMRGEQKNQFFRAIRTGMFYSSWSVGRLLMLTNCCVCV